MTVRRILTKGACVFMFHRILPRGQECYNPELVTWEDSFARFLDWAIEKYEILPTEVLVSRRAERFDSERPPCAITFDDGWVDNFQHAFPLLRARLLPATIFLPIRFIGTSQQFWQERLWRCLNKVKTSEAAQLVAESRRRFPWFRSQGILAPSEKALKTFLKTRASKEAEEFVNVLEECVHMSPPSDRSFVNWEEVELMRMAGISFGSHTLHHTLLSSSSPGVSEIEICKSREELTDRLGVRTVAFSYPWGACNALLQAQACESGYSFAVTAEAGLVNSGTNPWLVPRIAISNSIVGDSRRNTMDPARLSFVKQVTQATLSRFIRAEFYNKRIRIVFLIDQIADWEGGTERQLHTLITKLDRKYFEPIIISIFEYPEVPAESFPCPVLFISSKDKNVSSLARLVRLTRLLRRIGPDIFQSYFRESNTLGILAARLASVPVIIGTSRNVNCAERFFDRFALRVAALMAHSWQCNSRAVSNYVLKQVKIRTQKIDIFPNAVDLSKFVPCRPEQRIVTRCKLGLNAEGPIVVSVANLRLVKDLSTLIEAARLVHSRLPAAQFVLVGGGPLDQGLQEQVFESGLDKIVRFVGMQSNVIPYLASADFGVLTSRSEGSSNSLLEYMAAGLPTVVSDIPSNRELVEGIFFTPGDASELAKALLNLWLDEAAAQRLAERNRRAAEKYSVDEFIRRAEGYYNRLIPTTC